MSQPLRISFTGGTDTRWGVRALLAGGGTVAQDLTLDPTTMTGSQDLDPSGHQKLVLIVANLGLQSYSPNDQLAVVVLHVLD